MRLLKGKLIKYSKKYVDGKALQNLFIAENSLESVDKYQQEFNLKILFVNTFLNKLNYKIDFDRNPKQKSFIKAVSP